MAKQPTPKPSNPDKPLTTNQMLALFREVLDRPVAA
jgi:hypothetical protein